jgi:hypothetical protein
VKCREHGQRTLVAEQATTSTHLKETGSTRSLWSVPDEDGSQDQSAATLIPPRVLPDGERLESGASPINSVIAAATALAPKTCTNNFVSTSCIRSLTMLSKSSPSLRQDVVPQSFIVLGIERRCRYGTPLALLLAQSSSPAGLADDQEPPELAEA